MINLDKLENKVKETNDVFSWYKDLTKSEKITHLEELPLITEGILDKYYYNKEMNPSLSVYHTSGTSTGNRKKIYYSNSDDENYYNIKSKIYAKFIDSSGIHRAMSDMGTGHAANTATIVFQKLGLESESILFNLPIDEHIKRLRTFKPDLLYTMPSILDSIINAADNPQEFGIKKIILVGEIAPRHWITKIAKMFGIDEENIMDTYGSIEIGTIAYYSHDFLRYILVDEMYGEGICCSEVEQEIGELGDNEKILVLTSFARKMFPAIRFVTYDVVRDLRPILVDGFERQSFECIVKRVGKEIKHGEKISIYDIENLVFKHLDEAIVRVKVLDNHLTVFIKSKQLTKDKMKTIENELQEVIPEIGVMIRNGILGRIEVKEMQDDNELLQRTVKSKKIY